MPHASVALLSRYLRRLTARPGNAAPDHELLQRFIACHDDSAFAVLVERHAAMVLGLCRSILRNHHDAEDVFQAVFLVLARKAGSIRKRESVGGWLYAVAYRLAHKARLRAGKRRVCEHQAATPTEQSPIDDVTWGELRDILHEEVSRLPEKYRAAVVLCYWEGRTHEQAGEQLGCARSTIKDRLERAREMLRTRLARRGLALSAAWFAAALSEGTSAAVSAELLQSTLRGAMLFSMGQLPAGIVSAPAIACAREIVKGMLMSKLKYGLALVLMIGVLGGGAGLAMLHQATPPAPEVPSKPPKAASAPKQQRDQGEQLPEGVVACLGTTRFRALCDSLRFSTDGKTLVGVDGACQVRVWDAASGKLLRTRRLGDRPYRKMQSGSTARSADGRTLLIAEGASLQMWNLLSGKRLEARFPTDCKRLDGVVVSNDRRLLLLADTVKDKFHPNPVGGNLGRLEIEQHLFLWDTRTGRDCLLAKDEGMLVALVISPDGKRLASSSYGKGTCVYNAATGKLLWREPKFNAEIMAFTPDGRRLIAAPGGNQSSWHVWDAATGKPSLTFPAPKIGYVWTFALSPDGNRLIAPTETDYVLWDLPGGKELHRWPGAKLRGKVAFAPDGRSVVTADTILRRWDVASGKSLYPDVSALGHTASVRRLFFTPDSKRLASVGEDNTIRIWDVATAKPIHTIDLDASNPHRWDLSGDGGTARYPDGWTLTPDGATLIGVDKLWTAHRWSVADGRTLPRYELTAARQAEVRGGLRARHVRVALDGKTLVVAAWPRTPDYRYSRYSFSFWDTKTGELHRWGGDPSKLYRGDDAVLSPDGRYAVSKGQLFETRTGERRRMRPTRDGAEAIGGVTVFSPDGRLLAALGQKGHVWEVASGQPILDLPEIMATSAPWQTAGRLAAFTPNGRRFALAAPRHLLVCDLATRRIVVKHPVPGYLHRDVNWARGGVAFAPNGRMVATACEDGTILLWDVPPVARSEPLTESETAALCEDLAQDAPRGYAAVWRLQQDPETAVPFLRKRLPPAKRPKVDWPALIRQLDNDQFDKREAASRRLQALGRAAEDALRQALKDKPTLEQKKRLEELLRRLAKAPRFQITDLRVMRAVAVLEGINTFEARRVLREWAEGLPGAPLTETASQATARLKWRPASNTASGTR